MGNFSMADVMSLVKSTEIHTHQCFKGMFPRTNLEMLFDEYGSFAKIKLPEDNTVDIKDKDTVMFLKQTPYSPDYYYMFGMPSLESVLILEETEKMLRDSGINNVRCDK